jgi:hypothetical protein
MAMRLARCPALVITLILFAAGTAGAADKPVQPANPVNAKLFSMKPAERAALLAKAVGHWCIGTEAFQMGVATTGRGAGNAYWSLRCADGSAWALQIDPFADVTAVDCVHFNAQAGGKECFKRF